MEIAKEVGYPVDHMKSNNGVDCEYVSNVKEKKENDVQTKLYEGMWIEEQMKDTNKQKGTKQAEEGEKGKLDDCQEHSANHRILPCPPNFTVHCA
uniref:Uncharacterized protein n=1 Tax=Solanum tuberosum TaxID=4113 RepID=M1DSH8_SOLTU